MVDVHIQLLTHSLNKLHKGTVMGITEASLCFAVGNELGALSEIRVTKHTVVCYEHIRFFKKK